MTEAGRAAKDQTSAVQALVPDAAEQSPAGMQVPATVGDLVEAVDVPSVVRLADLADPVRRQSLGRAFLADPAVARWLGSLADSVALGRGRALVIEGPYGVGKSHLLAAIAIWASGEPVAGLPRRPSRAPVVAAVSLIEHAAAEPLEAAVRVALAGAVHAAREIRENSISDLPADLLRLPRREAFATVRRALAGRGLVILLDELSEYLRSKPAGPGLAEDVRFLQFLAEWAPSAATHVVAALNEPLEASLYLAPDLRRRLADRFPARLQLGHAHLSDLIARRLRRLRPGARPWLIARHAALRRSFGPLPFTAEAFADLYPFHPGTVAWLSDLSGLLSAQRGAVDFAVATLRGDPGRALPTFLAQPAGALICPDALCDHFADRLREVPATEPLLAQLLPALARDVPALFPDPDPRDFALRLAKLFVLAADANPPRPLGPRACTLALLHDLAGPAAGPAPNFEFTATVLARLAEAGALAADEVAAGQDGPTYRIAAELDDGLAFQRRLAHARSAAAREADNPFDRLAAWCDDPDLPLARLHGGGTIPLEFPWRGSRRVVHLQLASPATLGESGVRQLLHEVEASDADAAVLVVPPRPGEADRARRLASGHLRRWVASAAPRSILLTWLPRDPTPAEADVLLDALAHRALAADVPRVEAALPAVQGKVKAIYRALYAEGTLLGPDGVPVEAAALPLGERLAAILGAALVRRFPRHPELRLPATQGVFLHALRALCREGRCDAGQEGARALAEALTPFGLVAKTAGGGLRLQPDPAAAPVLGEVQAALRGASPNLPLHAADLYARLRRGSYGLQRRAFEVLLLLVVGAGFADLCRGGRRLGTEKLVPAALWEADGLAAGQLLAPGTAALLQGLPWLPDRLRRPPLTQATQREAWDAVREWCVQQAALATACQARLEDVGRLPSARVLAAGAAEDMRRLAALAAAADRGVGPCEGLSRFLFAWESQPEASALVERCGDLRRFLSEGFDPCLWATGYLEAAAGVLAADDPLQAERAALAARMVDPVREWSELLAAFERFRTAYAAAYRTAHAASVGPDALRAYQGIRSSAAGVVAATLAGLPAMESPLPWAAVEHRLQSVEAGACAATDAELAERLRQSPLCACGYRPSHPPHRPPAEAISGDAERSAQGYLHALDAPLATQRLRAHTAGLRVVGRLGLADRLSAFLRDVGRMTLPEAARALTGELAPALREALQGQLVVVDRDPAQLAERLRGRVLAIDGVLALVRAWLADIPAGGFVRLDAAQPTDPMSWREAAARLAETPGAGLARRVIDALWDREADSAEILRGLGTASGAYADACRAAADVVASIDAARRGAPTDVPGWEALWSGSAAQGARHLGRLRLLAAEAGLTPLPALTAWEAEWSAARASLGEAFAQVAPGPGIERLWPRMAGARHLWWLDALRADLAEDVVAALADVAEVRERGLLWARLPTTTEAQLAALRAAGCQAAILTWSEQDPSEPAGAIVRWPFLDDRIHGSKEPYGELVAGFAEQCRRRLRPALAALAAGAEVWLFSDHGFIERSGAPRYSHGDRSPEEVLVPWLRLVRRG